MEASEFTNEPKLCQSCIERGFKPAQIATREWQTGLFYCEDCFSALLENLTNIPENGVKDIIADLDNGNESKSSGPILDYIYQAYQVPKELQFDKVDTVCRNHDKIFNFHAPAVINRDLKDLQFEVEQLQMSLFQIKYRIEPLEMHIRKLKEEARAANNLKSYDDSKEVYAKQPKKASTTLKVSQEEKMAKTLGMDLTTYRQTMKEMEEKAKKNRERKFNILAGNCPECGGSMPCLVNHS